MKHKLRASILTFGLLLGLLAFLPAGTSSAINVIDSGCSGNKDSKICKSKGDSISPFVQSIVRLLIYAVGIVSVIMIIVGGLKYTTSNGDAARIKSAKETILYAVIGLVVAMLSFTIVAFVIDRFK